MEQMILGDIQKIDSIDTIHDAKVYQKLLVSKYRNEIPNIDKDLDKGYPALNGGTGIQADYMQNLQNLKGKLEMFLAKIQDEKNKPKEKSVSPVSIVNTNSSDNHANNTLSNTNTVNIELLFEEAKKQIEDNDSLSDEDITEILNKIEELEDLCKSDEKPRNKWSKAKETMTWLFDKGAKVAEVVLPLITEAIK